LRSTSTSIAEAPRSSFAVATGIWASPPRHLRRAETAHLAAVVLAHSLLTIGPKQ
jgi:hypothetical protein